MVGGARKASLPGELAAEMGGWLDRGPTTQESVLETIGSRGSRCRRREFHTRRENQNEPKM